METLGQTAVEAAKSRSNLYGLLAAAFRAEPTPTLLREIRKPDLRQALHAVSIDLGVDEGRCPDERLLDELAVEFTRLFVGPGGHIPPYAAVHLGGDWASLWGPDTVWVKDFIEGAGFSYRTHYQDLPDHVGVELEFMRQVASHEADALDKNDQDRAGEFRRIQEAFVRQHLARWLPEFCRKVEAAAGLTFYKGIARLAEDFVVSEAEALTLHDAHPASYAGFPT